MKKALLIITLAAFITSCAPGRWVGGNAKHFQQRADAKAQTQTAKRLPAKY